MRNLKRALSLTLASVMLLGMMVIGSSAAKGYPDVDENDNVEAIEVLQAIAVMVGDAETGNFRPDAPVSRAEMAVVMGLLLNLDYNYYVSTCPFADVSGNYEWARGWVGACAANGIIAGRSATSYDPGASVTAIEAASMMMRALGYFKNPEDYADGFQVVTVRQGSQIGIFSGIGSDAVTPMTRNQVAQLALNALRSNMVDFTGSLGVEVNGVKVNYRAEYTPRTSPESKYNAIANLATTILTDNGQYYIQLGEQLYDGKLKLNDNYQDAFGRPARRWEYDGKEIGTYAKYEQLRAEYTEKVTGKDLYELIGKGTIDDKAYDFYITVDGETEKDVLNSTTNAEKSGYFFDRDSLLRTNTNQVGGTGNGVLTQVFVDTDSKDVYISVINTYLAEAEADYNATKDEASFTLYDLTQYKTTGKLVKSGDATPAGDKDKTQMKASGEDFNVQDVKDGDKFLATVAEGEIKTLTAVKTIEDASITAFQQGSWLVTGDVQYDYASTARYDTKTLNNYNNNNMKDTRYRVFLDNYDYVIGVEIVEDPDQYVFLTAIDAVTQNRTDAFGEGTVIFLDGTVDSGAKIDLKKSKNAAGNTFLTGDDNHTITGNINDGYTYTGKGTGISSLMNTWCTYSISEDGVYTLQEVANTAASFSSSSKAGQSHLVDANQSADASKRYQTDSGTILQLGTNATDGVLVSIGKREIGMPGITNTNVRSVYGNNDSIYMSAETDMINADTTLSGTKRNAVIITGVDGITTGVQNANINVWNARRTAYEGGSAWQNNDPYLSDVSNGAYVLFGDNGYIIAAITVGEDESTNTQYAWVSSEKMYQEGYASNKWTYIREVIIDGVVTKLSEVETDGTTAADIKGDLPTTSNSYVWEVKTKADGTVKSATKITTWSPSSDNTDKFINDIQYREGNKNDTIILNQHFTASGAPWTVRAVSNTLQVETKLDNIYRGFPVAEDAKIVVVKDEEILRNGQSLTPREFNYKVEVGTWTNGRDNSGLETAVKSLNERNDFRGYIVAVFDGGVATSVILYDQTYTQVDIGSGGGGGDAGITSVDITDPTNVTVRWEGDTQPDLLDFIDAIVDELEAAGLRVTGMDIDSSGNYIFNTTGGRVDMPYVWDPTGGTQEQVTIEVDGNNRTVDKTSTNGTTLGAALGISDVGSYIKRNGSILAVGNSFTPAANDVVEFGFYKIGAAAAAATTGTDYAIGWDVALSSDPTDNPGYDGGYVYAKATATNVVLTITPQSGKTTTVKNSITTDTGAISGANTIEAGTADTDTTEITVSLTASEVTSEPTITLAAEEYVGSVQIKITYKGQQYTATVPDTTDDWLEVIKASNMTADDKLDAMNSYVRLDSDWTVGELPTGGSIDSDFKDVNGKLVNDTEVTMGCVSVGRAASDTLLGGTGDVTATWSADSGNQAWSDETDTFYMAPGETLDVEVEVASGKKPTAGSTASAVLTISIKSTTKPADTTVGATIASGDDFTGADNGDSALTLTTVKAGTTGNDTVTVTKTGSNYAADDYFDGGKVTFTITIGQGNHAGLQVDMSIA